jgi:hypothetical protein
MDKITSSLTIYKESYQKVDDLWEQLLQDYRKLLSYRKRFLQKDYEERSVKVM